jgi:long-chain acyl-CoA synthetase
MTIAHGERPWLHAYPPDVPADITLPTKSLTALLDQSVGRHGPRPALDFMGAVTTYRELGQQVAKAAEVLRRLGIGPGDRVPARRNWSATCGCLLRRAAPGRSCEHNPLYTEGEPARQLADHGALVIC